MSEPIHIYSDATYNQRSKRAYWSYSIKKGNETFYGAGVIDGLPNNNHAELYAFHDITIRLSKENDSPIIVHTDCSGLVYAFNKLRCSCKESDIKQKSSIKQELWDLVKTENVHLVWLSRKHKSIVEHDMKCTYMRK